MTKQDKWSQLSLQEKADLIKLYVDSGITDLKVMRTDYNGVPYASFNSSEYDYFGAAPENMPSVKGEHWTSRNPHTGQLLKREDHPTYNLMIEGEKAAGYTIHKGLDGNLYSSPSNYTRVPNTYANGGPIREGGYSEESLEDRKETHDKYDPAGGIGPGQLLYRFFSPGKSAGEEDEYWKAYLGLENNVPKMKPSSKTEWDDKVEEQKLLKGELPSDFYGTTHNMDLYIQAMADTTTTGQIVRDYRKFKALNPTLASKSEIEAMYRSGKDMMDNPGKWTQVGELKGRAQLDIEHKIQNNEEYPLGMLAKFGAKWIPEENTIHVHDTYDFPKLNKMFSSVPDRPKEMKIRGKVRYNPKNTAKLFNSDNFNLIFPK